MNRESYQQKQLDFLFQMEQATSIEALTKMYYDAAYGILNQHDERFKPITSMHDTGFSAALQNPDTVNIEDTMDRTAKAIDAAATVVPTQLVMLLDHAAKLIEPKLSMHDKKVLSNARNKAGIYGVGSRYVDEALQNASSREALWALKIIRDRSVLDLVQREVRIFGVGSTYVADARNLTSETVIAETIKASLDADVLALVRNNVQIFGVSSTYVTDAIKLGSSENVRSAIKSRLDEEVLSLARNEARIYGIHSTYTQNALHEASSPRVQQVFARKINAEFAQGSSREQHTYGDRTSFNAEDFIFGYFKRESGKRSTEGGNSHRPQQEAPRRPSRDMEVDDIIGRVIQRDRQYVWLINEEPIHVRRVINTVRKLREQATAKGSELSDRDVYIKYRKALEKASGAGETPLDPAIERSFQILSAMMGGKITGKLPF